MLDIKNKVLFTIISITILVIALNSNNIIINTPISNLILITLIICLSIHDLYLGIMWFLIYFIIRHNSLVISKFENTTTASDSIPLSKCSLSSFENCMLNCFYKGDDTLDIPTCRLHCCDQGFSNFIQNRGPTYDFKEAINNKTNILSNNCDCNPNMTTPAKKECIERQTTDRDKCISACQNKGKSENVSDVSDQCNKSCCIDMFSTCILKDNTSYTSCHDEVFKSDIKNDEPTGCYNVGCLPEDAPDDAVCCAHLNSKVKPDNTCGVNGRRCSQEKLSSHSVFCDCIAEPTKQVCSNIDKSRLNCVKGGLKSSTCNKLDNILHICSNDCFNNAYNNALTNNNVQNIFTENIDHFYKLIHENECNLN